MLPMMILSPMTSVNLTLSLIPYLICIFHSILINHPWSFPLNHFILPPLNNDLFSLSWLLFLSLGLSACYLFLGSVVLQFQPMTINFNEGGHFAGCMTYLAAWTPSQNSCRGLGFPLKVSEINMTAWTTEIFSFSSSAIMERTNLRNQRVKSGWGTEVQSAVGEAPKLLLHQLLLLAGHLNCLSNSGKVAYGSLLPLDFSGCSFQVPFLLHNIILFYISDYIFIIYT